MAVLITTEGIIKTIKPAKITFDIKELNSLIEGWIHPIKIGHVWVMHKEDSSESTINEIASYVFNISLRGPVLVVPSQQLPLEWETMEEDDYHYTGDEIDLSFLVALQKTLSIMKDSQDLFLPVNQYKEHWLYDPSISNVDDKTKEFLDQIFPFVVSEIQKLKENILFEDDDTIIKVNTPNDLKKTIEQMIDMYIEDEKYEECALLQKVVSEISS